MAIVLEEGPTFIFSSWICVTSGRDGFNSHLADTTKPEASASPIFDAELNNFVNRSGEMLLPDLAGELEQKSGSTPIST